MREAWDRVRDVVQKAHDKLSQPEAVFRDSLIENIREMCAVMPSLNIADDPHLEAVRRELEGKFASIVPDQLRNSVTFREDTSHQMKDILDKMSALYGS
jgi:predicted secreted Zn-dependent protease